jgi:hypothetical protein
MGGMYVTMNFNVRNQAKDASGHRLLRRVIVAKAIARPSPRAMHKCYVLADERQVHQIAPAR